MANSAPFKWPGWFHYMVFVNSGSKHHNGWPSQVCNVSFNFAWLWHWGFMHIGSIASLRSVALNSHAVGSLSAVWVCCSQTKRREVTIFGDNYCVFTQKSCQLGRHWHDSERRNWASSTPWASARLLERLQPVPSAFRVTSPWWCWWQCSTVSSLSDEKTSPSLCWTTRYVVRVTLLLERTANFCK